eukprot:g79818.t1
MLEPKSRSTTSGTDRFLYGCFQTGFEAHGETLKQRDIKMTQENKSDEAVKAVKESKSQPDVNETEASSNMDVDQSKASTSDKPAQPTQEQLEDGDAAAPRKRRRSKWDMAGPVEGTSPTKTPAVATIGNPGGALLPLPAGIAPLVMSAPAVVLPTPAPVLAPGGGAVLPGAAPLREGRRRRRWGSEADKVELPPGAAALVADNVSNDERQIYLLRLRFDAVTKKLADPAAAIAAIPAGDRSPSPPPKYDKSGKRTNTRIMRLTEKLELEKEKILEELIKLNPDFEKLQAGTKKRMLEHIIWIPEKKYPGYNFKGAIIGPRGQNHVRLEKETGCKISVRGRDVRKPKLTKTEEDDMDLHVFILAPNADALKLATEKIEALMIPVSEDERNRQLREVAMINGTFRPAAPCKVCGQEGHNMYACPQRTTNSWSLANVHCAVCGENTHIAVDCPKRGLPAAAQAKPDNLADEYASFMAELTGDGSELPPDPMSMGRADPTPPVHAPQPPLSSPPANPYAGRPSHSDSLLGPPPGSFAHNNGHPSPAPPMPSQPFAPPQQNSPYASRPPSNGPLPPLGFAQQPPPGLAPLGYPPAPPPGFPPADQAGPSPPAGPYPPPPLPGYSPQYGQPVPPYGAPPPRPYGAPPQPFPGYLPLPPQSPAPPAFGAPPPHLPPSSPYQTFRQY